MWITEWGAAASTAACTVWYWPLGPTVNSWSAAASEPANNNKTARGNIGKSTDPWELGGGEHIDDSGGAEGGCHDDHGRVLVGHRADDGRFPAEGVMAHGGEDGASGFGGHDSDEFAFVGDIERVEAQQFAGAADHFADPDGGLGEFHTDPGKGGDFVEGAREAAARGVAHAADGGRGGEHVAHQGVQGGGIAFDGSVEADVLAFGEDGNAVIAEGAGEQHEVAGPGVGGGEVDAGADASDAGGIDENAVARALFDNLGIAGAEEERLDNEAIGGEGEALGADLQNGLIVEAAEDGAAEDGEEEVAQQVGLRFAPGPGPGRMAA